MWDILLLYYYVYYYAFFLCSLSVGEKNKFAYVETSSYLPPNIFPLKYPLSQKNELEPLYLLVFWSTNKTTLYRLNINNKAKCLTIRHFKNSTCLVRIRDIPLNHD